MQEKSLIFYKTIAKIIKQVKKSKNIKYVDLCYENDISTSTYDNIVNAKSQATFYNIAKVIKGLNMSFEDFGRMLDNELPEKFSNYD